MGICTCKFHLWEYNGTSVIQSSLVRENTFYQACLSSQQRPHSDQLLIVLGGTRHKFVFLIASPNLYSTWNMCGYDITLFSALQSSSFKMFKPNLLSSCNVVQNHYVVNTFKPHICYSVLWWRTKNTIHSVNSIIHSSLLPMPQVLSDCSHIWVTKNEI